MASRSKSTLRTKARIRDPERTRQRLLAAATSEFAKRGLTGARVASIARRAGTNLQAISHHFGGKEALYATVIENLYSVSWFTDMWDVLDRKTPLEALKAFVTSRFRSYYQSRSMLMLVVDENFHRARHMRTEKMRPLFERVVARLGEVLAEGERQGVVRPGIDPTRFYLSVISLAREYFISIHVNGAALGRDFEATAEIDAWEAHIVDMVLNSVRPNSAAAGSLPSGDTVRKRSR